MDYASSYYLPQGPYLYSNEYYGPPISGNLNGINSSNYGYPSEWTAQVHPSSGAYIDAHFYQPGNYAGQTVNPGFPVQPAYTVHVSPHPLLQNASFPSNAVYAPHLTPVPNNLSDGTRNEQTYYSAQSLPVRVELTVNLGDAQAGVKNKQDLSATICEERRSSKNSKRVRKRSSLGIDVIPKKKDAAVVSNNDKSKDKPTKDVCPKDTPFRRRKDHEKRNFPKQYTNIEREVLTKAFRKNPWPPESKKCQLQKKLMITRKQVTDWFSRKRAQAKKQKSDGSEMLVQQQHITSEDKASKLIPPPSKSTTGTTRKRCCTETDIISQELIKVFNEHRGKIPSFHVMRKLSIRLSLKYAQVYNWFQNRSLLERQHIKVPMMLPGSGRKPKLFRFEKLKTLEEIYSNNPRPSLNERIELSRSRSIPMRTIYQWFRRRRQRGSGLDESKPSRSTRAPTRKFIDNQSTRNENKQKDFRFSKEHLDELKKVFYKHGRKTPPVFERKEMCQRLGLPYSKVSQWFFNRAYDHQQPTDLPIDFARPFTVSEITILNMFVSKNPKSTVEERVALAEKLGVTFKMVSYWIRNKQRQEGMKGRISH